MQPPGIPGRRQPQCGDGHAASTQLLGMGMPGRRREAKYAELNTNRGGIVREGQKHLLGSARTQAVNEVRDAQLPVAHAMLTPPMSTMGYKGGQVACSM